jgi:hypothetical protein
LLVGVGYEFNTSQLTTNSQQLTTVSIGAGGGVEGQVKELALDVFGWGGAGLTAGGGGDDGEELEIGEGGAGNIEALGVGTSVGRGEEEAVVVGEGVEEGAVGGGEALQKIARLEGEAEPEALGAGTCEEGAAGEALGVDGVREVEIADVAYGLDIVERQRDESSGEIEKVD